MNYVDDELMKSLATQYNSLNQKEIHSIVESIPVCRSIDYYRGQIDAYYCSYILILPTKNTILITSTQIMLIILAHKITTISEAKNKIV